MERLQNKHSFGLMAVSLGYADTLMSLSAASTSSELSDADKAKADISDGYVRMSIGITGATFTCRVPVQNLTAEQGWLSYVILSHHSRTVMCAWDSLLPVIAVNAHRGTCWLAEYVEISIDKTISLDQTTAMLSASSAERSFLPA